MDSKVVVAFALVMTLVCHTMASTEEGVLEQLLNLRSRSQEHEKRDIKAECYIRSDGEDYRGTVSTTENGKTCQKWTSQTPHEHDYTPANYPFGLGDHNYCRNPDGEEPRPWCFTTDSWTRWDFCDIGESQYTCIEPVEIIEEGCYIERNGADYRGTVSKTKTGKTCQKWTSQTPHQHSRTPAYYPDSDVGDHNYCRNPDGEKEAWCFTSDEDTRWEYCDIGIPQCRCTGLDGAFKLNGDCMVW